jgi:hypothetical protein
MSEWNPIETAPRDGTHILAYGWNPNAFANDPGRFAQREIWRAWNGTFRYVPVGNGLFRQEDARSDDRWEPDRQFIPTHWMPLPEPPGHGWTSDAVEFDNCTEAQKSS